MAEKPARGGRPPQGPRVGKSSILNTRITLETRQALEEEAARSSRSLSQVAEAWLDEARRGHASAEQLLGGPDIAPVLRAMAEVAARVIAAEGYPSDNLKARDALRAAWIETMMRVLPAPQPSIDELEVIRLAKAGDADAAQILFKASLKERGEAFERGRQIAADAAETLLLRLVQESGMQSRLFRLWAAQWGLKIERGG